jgi:hypothetical protein
LYFWSGSGTNYFIIISFIGALIPWGSTTPLKAVGRTWDDLKDHHQEHHLYKLGRPKPHGPQAVDQRISQ